MPRKSDKILEGVQSSYGPPRREIRSFYVNNAVSNAVNNLMEMRAFRNFVPWGAGALRHGVPCVGLIAFLGCFTFLIAPDDNFLPAPPPNTAAASQHSVLPGSGPPTVIIDPGHGGIDDGTKYYGLAEKDVTLDVAQRLERLLDSVRVDTVMTRRDDVYVSLPERAEIANMVAGVNSNAVFVSIHFNQSADENVDGIETYYADEKIPPPTDWTWVGFFDRPEDQALDRGENLAADVQSALASRMMETNRGIKSRSLFVTRHTRMPAILVEGGFLSNKIENQSLRNDSYRERIARGIAAGLLTYIRTTHPSIPLRMATADAQ